MKEQRDLKEVQKSLKKKAPEPEEKQADMRGLTGVKSKYDEDVFENGHTSVWGSYWSPNIGWGYRCCF